MPEDLVVDLQSEILNLRYTIDEELTNLMAKISDRCLQPKIKYAVLSPGKRLRPILLLLSAGSVGGDIEKAMPLALSIELLHTATLIHDDIIDKDMTRRGSPTLHEKWSIGDALLVGDALIALSINLASDYGAEVVKIISQTGVDLCEGEHLDISTPLVTMTENQYFTKIKGKSASLFRASAHCGAVVGGGTDLEIIALTRLGELFGLAYQMRDDLDSLQVENHIPNDIKNGNVTLPLIHLYTHGGSKIKGLLERNFGKSDISSSTVREMLDSLKATGSLLYCEQKIMESLKAAYASLSIIRDSKFKPYLTRLLDVVLDLRSEVELIGAERQIETHKN